MRRAGRICRLGKRLETKLLDIAQQQCPLQDLWSIFLILDEQLDNLKS